MIDISRRKGTSYINEDIKPTIYHIFQCSVSFSEIMCVLKRQGRSIVRWNLQRRRDMTPMGRNSKEMLKRGKNEKRMKVTQEQKRDY